MLQENKIVLGVILIAGVGGYIFMAFAMLPGFVDNMLYRHLMAIGFGVFFSGFIYLNNKGGDGGDGGGGGFGGGDFGGGDGGGGGGD